MYLTGLLVGVVVGTWTGFILCALFFGGQAMYEIKVLAREEGVLATDRARTLSEAKTKALGWVLDWRHDGVTASIYDPDGRLVDMIGSN